MAINPETNRIEPCTEATDEQEMMLAGLKGAYATLVRSDGQPIPKHWTILKVGELVVVKDYTFRVAYLNDASITLEPVSPLTIAAELDDQEGD